MSRAQAAVVTNDAVRYALEMMGISKYHSSGSFIILTGVLWHKACGKAG